jgi:hypothetical protein
VTDKRLLRGYSQSKETTYRRLLGQVSGKPTKRSHDCEIYLIDFLECSGSDWPFLSLNDLLENTAASDLSFADRLRLALLVASAALQLHGTPWMPGPFMQNDIFVRQDTRPGVGHGGDAYLFRHFPLGPSQKLPLAAAGMASWPSSPSLLCLGTILVKLMIGYTIRHIIKDSDYSSVEECLLDRDLSRKVLDQLTMVAGKGYAGAVRRCVQGHLRMGGWCKDGGLPTDVIVEIVGLLEEDFRLACLEL